MKSFLSFWGAGRVSRRRTWIPVAAEVQRLEGRTLPSSTVSGGILRVTGGSGHDTITVNATTTSVSVTENGTTRTFQRSAVRQVSVNGSGGNDTITLNAELRSTLKGGSGNDSITGSNKSDKMYGEAGNDTLFGRNGDDTLDGGAGNDNLNGGAGDDDLLGQAGNDTVTGGLGDDYINAGAGTNTVFSNSENDLVVAAGTTVRPDTSDPVTGGVDPTPTVPGGGGGGGGGGSSSATANDTTGAITITASSSASLSLDGSGFLLVSLNGGSVQGPFRLPESPHTVTVTAPNVAIATEVAAALGNRLIVNGVAGSGGNNNGGGGGGGAGTVDINAPIDSDSMTLTVTGSANLVIDFLAATDSGPVFRILLNGAVQGEASGYRVSRLTINRTASTTVTVDSEISTALGGNLTINLI